MSAARRDTATTDLFGNTVTVTLTPPEDCSCGDTLECYPCANAMADDMAREMIDSGYRYDEIRGRWH